MCPSLPVSRYRNPSRIHIIQLNKIRTIPSEVDNCARYIISHFIPEEIQAIKEYFYLKDLEHMPLYKKDKYKVYIIAKYIHRGQLKKILIYTNMKVSQVNYGEPTITFQNIVEIQMIRISFQNF